MLRAIIIIFTTVIFPFIIHAADTSSRERPADTKTINSATTSGNSEESKVLSIYRSESKWPKDVNDLITFWNSLQAILNSWEEQLEELETEIDELNGKYYAGIEGEIAYWEGEVDWFKNEIDRLKAIPANDRTDIEQDDLDFYQSQLEYSKSELANISNEQVRINENSYEISRLQVVIDEGKQIAREMELSIHDQVSSDKRSHDMRLWLGVVFGVLVGILIAGFFYIARKHEFIANAIFAGPSGIQFITLFLLVMALAIFGLTKILEGKELAALLGSISGYILGRGLSEGKQGKSRSDGNVNGEGENEALT